MRRFAFVTTCLLLAFGVQIAVAAPPAPTHADVSYGAHPNQIIDIYLPTQGQGPYPVVMWYGGLWKPAKHPVRLDYFLPKECAVVAVELRTMTEAMENKVAEPVSYIMDDACRAVQFV